MITVMNKLKKLLSKEVKSGRLVDPSPTTMPKAQLNSSSFERILIAVCVIVAVYFVLGFLSLMGQLAYHTG
jgi:hypothetical protein